MKLAEKKTGVPSPEVTAAIKDETIMLAVLRHCTEEAELVASGKMIVGTDGETPLFRYSGEVGKPGMTISIDLPHSGTTRHFKLMKAYEDPNTGNYWNHDSGFKGMIFHGCDESGRDIPGSPAYVIYPGTDHERIQTALVEKLSKGVSSDENSGYWQHLLKNAGKYIKNAKAVYNDFDAVAKEAPVWEYTAIAMNIIGRSNRRGTDAMEFVRENAELLKGRDVISVGNSLGARAAIWGAAMAEALDFNNAGIKLYEGFCPDTAFADAANVLAKFHSKNGVPTSAREVLEKLLEKTTTVALDPHSLSNTPSLGTTYRMQMQHLYDHSTQTYEAAKTDPTVKPYVYLYNVHVFSALGHHAAKTETELCQYQPMSIEEVMAKQYAPSDDLGRAVNLAAKWVLPVILRIRNAGQRLGEETDLEKLEKKLRHHVKLAKGETGRELLAVMEGRTPSTGRNI